MTTWLRPKNRSVPVSLDPTPCIRISSRAGLGFPSQALSSCLVGWYGGTYAGSTPPPQHRRPVLAEGLQNQPALVIECRTEEGGGCLCDSGCVQMAPALGDVGQDPAPLPGRNPL